MNEEWKEIAGFEGAYEVSSHGRVRSLRKKGRGGFPRETPLVMVGSVNPVSGYRQFNLSKDGRITTYFLHRLVLETFVGEPACGLEASHLDGDKHNNRLENLAWKTRSENMQDKHVHGTASPKRNKSHYNRLTKDAAVAIRKLYSQGWTKQAISSAFGVSWTAVHYVIIGRTWAL